MLEVEWLPLTWVPLSASAAQVGRAQPPKPAICRVLGDADGHLIVSHHIHISYRMADASLIRRPRFKCISVHGVLATNPPRRPCVFDTNLQGSSIMR